MLRALDLDIFTLYPLNSLLIVKKCLKIFLGVPKGTVKHSLKKPSGTAKINYSTSTMMKQPKRSQAENSSLV